MAQRPSLRSSLFVSAAIMAGTWIGKHRYTALLALLCVSVAFQSFAIDGGTGGVVSDLVRTALGVTIFLVVFERKLERAVFAVVLAAMIAIGWSRHFALGGADDPRAFLHYVLSAMFLWATVFVILRELFRAQASAGRTCWAPSAATSSQAMHGRR